MRSTGVKTESDSVHASTWIESFNLRSSKSLFNRHLGQVTQILVLVRLANPRSER